MHYSLECSELLANPGQLSPFSPEQQRRNLSGVGLSAEMFIGQLLHMRLLDDTSLVSVPYLNAFVKYNRPRIPTIDAAAAFARTKNAQMAIDATFTSFDMANILASEIAPQNRFTVEQACGQLYINRQRVLRLIGMSSIELQPDEKRRGAGAQHFAAEDLSLLYRWQYPEDYRQPPTPIDSPKVPS